MSDDSDNSGGGGDGARDTPLARVPQPAGEMVLFGLTANDFAVSEQKPIVKALRSFDARTTVRSFIRDTLSLLRPDYIYADDNIVSVESDCGTDLSHALDATFADLVEFFVDVPTKKMLTVEIVGGYCAPGHAHVSASSSSSDAGEPTSKKKKKKKKAKKKRRKAEEEETVEKPRRVVARKKKRAEKNNGADAAIDDANEQGDVEDDSAIAAALLEQYHEYVEGGRTFEAHVIDYRKVSTGPSENDFVDKFLVEWKKRADTADAPAAAASSASSSAAAFSESTSSAAPSSILAQPASSNSESLCTSWTRLDRFIAPSAALAYLDSTDRFPAWEVEEIRKRVVAFANELKADNTRLKEPDEPAACWETCFCCYICRCDREETSPNVTKCDVISKYHRNCCHGLDNIDKQESFRSSLGFAQEKLIKDLPEETGGKPSANSSMTTQTDSSSSSSESSGSASDSMSFNKLAADEDDQKNTATKDEQEKERFLASRMKSARSRESRTDNDLALPAPDSIRQSNEAAVKVHQDFYYRICSEREANPELKRRAVVLDVFSGIGGAEIALKKLGIDIQRVIVVEHDPVARHVYRQNHDHTYGGGATDDGIEYIFLYDTFEECENNLETLVRDYGPIDIIPGGPPCQEWSKVNAFRSGVGSESGRYMQRFAKFISRVREYNQKHHDGFNDLFFLVENVPGAEDATLRNEYGVPEYRLDAALFGPCHRDRIFYFNWAPDRIPDDEHAAGGTTCFEDGWMMPSMFKKGIDAKVMTLLASKGRTKDDTLHKWKIMPGMESAIQPGEDRPARHGEYQLIDINDRERLMGLPLKYVDQPVEELFEQLRVALTVGMEYNTEWRDAVPPKYWNFVGLGPEEYSFGIDDAYDDYKRISLSLKERNQRKKVVMKDYEYGWHLIGNGFSIPQVRHHRLIHFFFCGLACV